MLSKQNLVLLLITSMVFLTSCEVVGGIFKAGVWVGVILVVIVVALVLWLLGKLRK